MPFLNVLDYYLFDLNFCKTFLQVLISVIRQNKLTLYFHHCIFGILRIFNYFIIYTIFKSCAFIVIHRSFKVDITLNSVINFFLILLTKYFLYVNFQTFLVKICIYFSDLMNFGFKKLYVFINFCKIIFIGII